MTRICVYINSCNGCTLHRLLVPYHKMALMTDDFDIEFLVLKKDSLDEMIKYINGFDYFVFNRSMDLDMLKRIKEETSVKIICDNDDDWILGKDHPLYMTYKISDTSDKIKTCMEMSDIITTTTDYLANKIREVCMSVFVIPNALSSEDQFVYNDSKEKRLRLGIIGSSSHTSDMELLDGIAKLIKYYKPELLDKIQFVLCGFDDGKTTVFDRRTNNLLRVEDVPAEKTCWGDWERSLTDNYSTVSDSYREFLKSYIKEDLIAIDEPYVRIWTKDIFEYGNLYNCIDVLLVPLKDNEFNKSKSPLKLAEASVKGKAVICSNVKPYKDYLKNGENCIAINNKKGIIAWILAIEKLVNDEEFLNKIRSGLTEFTSEGNIFNLEEVTKKRIDLFKTKF